MTPVREADRLRQARINRRAAGRNRRDHYRAKAIARIMGTDWSTLDEEAVKRWHHMAHEMTHLRLDARWRNPLLIAVRMALQVDADPAVRKALRETTEVLGPHADEHLFFLSLPAERQLAWYTAALSVGDVFPSPNDRAMPMVTS